MQPPFCRSICRRRLNYVRYEKHCPTFPPMSIKILQSILREELVVCVKHANFIENLLLSSFHIQCKNETPRSFVYMHSQLERRGKEGKKQTNRKTWSMQRLQNLFLCVFHSNIISHFPSFLTLSYNWMKYEKCHHRIRFQKQTSFGVSSITYGNNLHVFKKNSIENNLWNTTCCNCMLLLGREKNMFETHLNSNYAL